MSLFCMADTIFEGDCASFDLTMVVPFKENGMWYFQLRYHVVKLDGEEGEVIIPKVKSPFDDRFPATYGELSFSPRNKNYTEMLSLRDDKVGIEWTQYEGRECLYYYVKTKDAPIQEMTHEEIEEELGHPFKEVKKKSTKKKED